MNLKTRLRSALMGYLSSPRFQQRQQRKGRRARQPELGPIVHYFHQVDDPYSHLAIQKLDLLRERYVVGFEVHLVSASSAAFQGSAEHFGAWAQTDAQQVAASYGATFVPGVTPTTDAAFRAMHMLCAHTKSDDFARRALEVGNALWAGELTSDGAVAPPAEVSTGNALRSKLGHYAGGMFFFEGEWYWGLDRLRLLETRLIEEGLSRGQTILIQQPHSDKPFTTPASDITVEYFPSLRSPYTAVGHARALNLFERSGVKIKLRPVLPMMMRGIPAPQAKQRYIITDSGREARAFKVPFGPMVDPFGAPVRRAFALFPGAVALDKGMPFVTAYLRAAWAEGTDITTQRGLQKVASEAGLPWPALCDAASGQDWETLLEENLNAMLSENLWGVPSFRVSGGHQKNAFACWGQDRIWRVEEEIHARMA